jgi:hypothetical protein
MGALGYGAAAAIRAGHAFDGDATNTHPT